VYRPSIEPLTEASPIGPATPYGVSKLAQEMAVRASPLPVLLARSFNHAGPAQDPSYVTSAFARQLADIEAGRADPVLRVGNLESIRDITDVRDVARAYRLLLHRGVPHEPYNVCSGRGHRIADLLELLLSMTPARIRVDRDPDRLRPSDTPVVVGSHDRLTRDTGWYPQIPIERTLADLLEYWRAAAAQPNPHPA
jgi:GDP-4-dehydro-6-deoxy-D-mannose reductase